MAIQDQNKWYTKHVEKPWWSIVDYAELDYTNEPFNDPTTQKKWKQLGYAQNKFTGDLYGMPNETPKFVKEFEKTFKWKNFSWQLYRMMPGTVLPSHKDTYAKFRQVNGVVDPNTIWRAVVFLEDWQSGHYFEIDNTNLSYWKKGDYVVWQNSVGHVAANIGETPRYTLQITGTQ